VTRPAETDPLLPLQPSHVRERLTEAIRTLSEAEHLNVTFYFYEGLTTEEIAFLLDWTGGRYSSDSCLRHFAAAH
jgi:DNA-directed RNA polymerase specialized sigma subunit